MSDVPTEGVVIRVAPQPVLGTDAVAEWTQLQVDKGSIQGLHQEPQTIERNIHDPYMVNRKGRVVGWSVKSGFAHDFNKDFADVIAEPTFRCVGAHPGGQGQRKYRWSAIVDGGAGVDSYTVPALGALPPGTLVKIRGAANPANNNTFKTVAGSTGVSIQVATGTVIAEAANPGNATLGIVGFEAAVAGDLQIDAAFNLISATEDFTTRGIVQGMLLQIGDVAAINQFGTLGILFAWVSGPVTAHKVPLEAHFIVSGAALAADAGAGKNIRVRIPSLYRNVAILDANYKKGRLEAELELPFAGSDGTTRWIYGKGLAVDKLTIAAPLKGKITATVSFIGTDATKPLPVANRLPAGAGPGAGPANAYAPLVVNLEDTATDLKFSRLLDAGVNLCGKINSWTLELQNNVTPLEAQGTAGAVDHIYGGFTPSVKASVYFDNSQQIDAATNNDDLSWDACIDNGDFMAAWRMPRTAIRNPNLQIKANTVAMLDFDAPGFGHESTNLAEVLCIFE